MDRAKAEAWQRFYDQVLSCPDWPRGLRLAAIEDALRAALGAESRLLADYRTDAAELLRLERGASASSDDEKRIAQIDAQIERLIQLADTTIRQADGLGEDAPATAIEVAVAALERPRYQLGPGLSLILAAVLLLAGVAGYYELRMAAQADQQIARMTRLLDERVADLHAEFRADINEFGATMTESVRSITMLSDNLIAELELSAEDGGVSESIGQLWTRTAELGQNLDKVGLELSSLENRLPELRNELMRITTGVQRTGSGLSQADAELDAVQAAGSELTAWLAAQKGELEQALQNGRGALREIDAKIGEFESEANRKVKVASREALDDLAKARETQFALLAARISSTQRELEQTRAALVISSQRMDQVMAERQSRVLAGLDSYARTIEARVEEFLNALDVMVARTDG